MRRALSLGRARPWQSALDLFAVSEIKGPIIEFFGKLLPPRPGNRDALDPWTRHLSHVEFTSSRLTIPEKRVVKSASPLTQSRSNRESRGQPRSIQVQIRIHVEIRIKIVVTKKTEGKRNASAIVHNRYARVSYLTWRFRSRFIAQIIRSRFSAISRRIIGLFPRAFSAAANNSCFPTSRICRWINARPLVELFQSIVCHCVHAIFSPAPTCASGVGVEWVSATTSSSTTTTTTTTTSRHHHQHPRRHRHWSARLSSCLCCS